MSSMQDYLNLVKLKNIYKIQNNLVENNHYNHINRNPEYFFPINPPDFNREKINKLDIEAYSAKKIYAESVSLVENTQYHLALVENNSSEQTITYNEGIFFERGNKISFNEQLVFNINDNDGNNNEILKLSKNEGIVINERIIVNDLEIKGDLTYGWNNFPDNVTIGDHSIDVDGFDINNIHTQNLNVSGIANICGKLELKGNASLLENLDIRGVTNIFEKLNVSGESNLNKLNVSGLTNILDDIKGARKRIIIERFICKR